jgi:uncharacterized protein
MSQSGEVVVVCCSRLLTVVFCAALSVLPVCPLLAQGQVSGITVSGTSTVKAKPDIAFVTLGVATDDKDAGKAAQANARTSTAVIDAILSSGVQRSDVETVQYSVSPVMNYQTSPATVTGYRVSNVVRVRLKDLTKIGSVIDTAVDAGSNGVEGVRFDLADSTKVRHQALLEAMRKAQEDAALMAQTLQVKLGKVVSASETGPIVPSPLDMGAVRAGAAASPIIPGEIEVTASVTVVYSIL